MMKTFKIIQRLTLPKVHSYTWVSLCLVAGIFIMKEIKLTKSQFALVDDEDFEWLNQFHWSAKINKHTIYAYRSSGSKCIWMHREILAISHDKDLRGDHIDHNGLNNTRKNLRIATHKQNNCYKKSAKNSTSKYLGVSFCKITNKWRATIYNNYKQKSLGRYDTEEQAGLAYNDYAIKIHGEFANLNVIKL